MTNQWMLDVLADLKTFSHQNGLKVTGDQLDRLMNVAAAEIHALQGIAHGTAQGTTNSIGHVGEPLRTIAAGRNT